MLVDTSVWIDHLRFGNPDLAARLEASQVWTHPFVVGELACGQLDRRDEILADLRSLPLAPLASDDEVLAFLQAHGLSGKGLGWIDVHLLASARLAHVPLWTLDKPLATAARELRLWAER